VARIILMSDSINIPSPNSNIYIPVRTSYHYGNESTSAGLFNRNHGW